MTTQLQKQQVLEVEKRFWDAMKKKDAQTASRMTDDGCIVVGAQGASAIAPPAAGRAAAAVWR